MEINEIMERLFGTIAPVGETNEDQRRLENVDKIETALNYIIEELLNGYDYIGSNRISEYKIAEKAKDILIDLKNKLVDTLIVDLDEI